MIERERKRKRERQREGKRERERQRERESARAHTRARDREKERERERANAHAREQCVPRTTQKPVTCAYMLSMRLCRASPDLFICARVCGAQKKKWGEWRGGRDGHVGKAWVVCHHDVSKLILISVQHLMIYNQIRGCVGICTYICIRACV